MDNSQFIADAKTLLHELLVEAEDDHRDNDFVTGHYVHYLRWVYAQVLGLRFPDNPHNSPRMTSDEFQAYAVGICGANMHPYAICGKPVMNKATDSFKLKNVFCSEHTEEYISYGWLIV